MSRKNPIAAREKEIGKRLRAFREYHAVPLSKFALKIGIGSERLRSYEAGRVPMRFDVLVALSKTYRIDPYWLATGHGDVWEMAFIEDEILNDGNGNELFTVAYDRIFARGFDPVRREVQRHLTRLVGDAAFLVHAKDELAPLLRESPRNYDSSVKNLIYIAKEMSKLAPGKTSWKKK